MYGSTQATVGVDGSWQARFGAALQDTIAIDSERDPSGSRWALEALYHTVLERVVELRKDGVHPERALLTLKRAAQQALSLTDADNLRADERRALVIQHVIRWSVEAYFRAEVEAV